MKLSYQITDILGVTDRTTWIIRVRMSLNYLVPEAIKNFKSLLHTRVSRMKPLLMAAAAMRSAVAPNIFLRIIIITIIGRIGYLYDKIYAVQIITSFGRLFFQ